MKPIIATILLATLCAGCQQLEDLNKKQGAGRYQIAFSPLIVRATFLLDTKDGRVWLTVADKDGRIAGFQPLTIEPNYQKAFDSELYNPGK